MSKGPGRVMRAVKAAMDAEPSRQWDAAALAAIVYPNEPFERKHAVAVGRAMKALNISVSTKAATVKKQSEGSADVWKCLDGMARGKGLIGRGRQCKKMLEMLRHEGGQSFPSKAVPQALAMAVLLVHDAARNTDYLGRNFGLQGWHDLMDANGGIIRCATETVKLLDAMALPIFPCSRWRYSRWVW